MYKRYSPNPNINDQNKLKNKNELNNTSENIFNNSSFSDKSSIKLNSSKDFLKDNNYKDIKKSNFESRINKKFSDDISNFDEQKLNLKNNKYKRAIVNATNNTKINQLNNLNNNIENIKIESLNKDSNVENSSGGIELNSVLSKSGTINHNYIRNDINNINPLNNRNNYRASNNTNNFSNSQKNFRNINGLNFNLANNRNNNVYSNNNRNINKNNLNINKNNTYNSSINNNKFNNFNNNSNSGNNQNINNVVRNSRSNDLYRGVNKKFYVPKHDRNFNNKHERPEYPKANNFNNDNFGKENFDESNRSYSKKSSGFKGIFDKFFNFSKSNNSKSFLGSIIPDFIYNKDNKKIFGLVSSEDLFLISLIFLFLDDEEDQIMVYAFIFLLVSDWVDLSFLDF